MMDPLSRKFLPFSSEPKLEYRGCAIDAFKTKKGRIAFPRMSKGSAVWGISPTESLPRSLSFREVMEAQMKEEAESSAQSVSYTHLTLPTIYSV